jgi:hypothetical protein
VDIEPVNLLVVVKGSESVLSQLLDRDGIGRQFGDALTRITPLCCRLVSQVDPGLVTAGVVLTVPIALSATWPLAVRPRTAATGLAIMVAYYRSRGGPTNAGNTAVWMLTE